MQTVGTACNYELGLHEAKIAEYLVSLGNENGTEVTNSRLTIMVTLHTILEMNKNNKKHT